MDSFNEQTFHSEVGTLILDVDLEVSSGNGSDNSRDERESLCERGPSFEDNEESQFLEEETDYDEEPEVDIDEVMVGQQLVGVPFDPSILLYVKKERVESDIQEEVSLVENSVTKALRRIKRPPKVRPLQSLNEPTQNVCIDTPEQNVTSNSYSHFERTNDLTEVTHECSNKNETKTKKKKSKTFKKVKLKAEESQKCETSYLRIDADSKVNEEKKHLSSDNLSDEDNYFECAHCGRKFREKSHLATHSRAHIDVRNFKCLECGLLFKTETNLKFHMKTHEEAPFNCNECKKNFPERKILKRHMRVVHSSASFNCEQCGRTFKSATNLTLHYSLHTGTKPFTCSICSKSFVYKSTLSAHLRVHESLAIGGSCEECKKCHHNCASRTDCRSCRNEDLKGKLCTHQSLARPYLCTVCGKAYPLKGTLKNHMKTHEPEKPYKCKECPKSFMKKQSLECHIKQSHRSERPEFMCDQCSLSYYNAFALKRHYAKHTSNKTFTCQSCGKSFWTKDALRVHSRTHSPIKGFPCPNCPKAFSHKHTLDAHLRTHFICRPHQCSLCPKSFVHKYNMLRHERQHSQGLPIL